MSDKKYKINESMVSTSIYFRNANQEDIVLLLENDFHVILPTESEDNYDNITSQLFRLINNSEFLCKNLNKKYILDSFDEADAIVIIGSKEQPMYPNGNIFGFVSLFFDESNNSLYIDIICSHVGTKGIGAILLETIKDICKKTFFTKITLNSIKSAIPFYNKFGFSGKRCNEKGLCKMTKKIGGYKKIRNKTKRRTNKK